MMKLQWVILSALLMVAVVGCGSINTPAASPTQYVEPQQPFITQPSSPTTIMKPLQPTESSEENQVPTTLTPGIPKQEDNMPKDSPLPTGPIPGDDMPKDPPLTISKSPSPPVLIESAKADLAQRLSVSASQIKAIETKEAVWPDASLGCPQPGIVYAQVQTPGYIIMLEYAGDKFEYHASIRSEPLYCENPMPPIS